MPHRHVLIFGGSTNDVLALGRTFPRYCTVRHMTWEECREDQPGMQSGLVVAFWSKDISEQFQAIRRVANAHSIPFLILAEEMPFREVIRLFHSGITVFPFPLGHMEEEWYDTIDRLLSRPQNSATHSFLPDMQTEWKKSLIDMGRRAFQKLSFVKPQGEISRSSAEPTKSNGDNNQQEVLPVDLDVRLFGRLSITFAGKKLPVFPGRKKEMILAYLLYHHGQVFHREQLMEKFWPDCEPSSARNSLNVTIHAIRSYLSSFCSPDNEFLIFQRESYQWNPDLYLVTDVQIFREIWKGRHRTEEVDNVQADLRKAYELYQGDLLQNLPYAEWCQEEREHLREIFIQICDRLSQIHFEREEFRLAIPYCERMLEIDPCLEEAYRMLMVCYARGGKRNLAIRQFEKCKRTLHRELSIEPSQLTRDTATAIQEGKPPSFYLG